MPRPALKTRDFALMCAGAWQVWAHWASCLLRALAGTPTGESHSGEPPSPFARPSPSAVASSHPSSPPAHIALRSAQGERPTAFSSTLVVKESHAILGEGHWQHHEAVQSRFGQVMCMFFAGSVKLCARAKFCSPCGRRIGPNAHVGARIGVVWVRGGPSRQSRGRLGRAGRATLQGNSSPT